MSVANLEAYAMSKGITKAYNAMTQAEQATLRYNYLLDATAGAQGDFARTAGDYANQIRVFEENVNSILTKAGEGLKNFITPILKDLNEALDKAGKTTVEQQLKDIENEEARALAEAKTKETRGLAMIDVLEELEGQVEMTEKDTEIWQNTLEKLVQLFPELSGYIDLETGKIKTNTDALRENVKAATETARDKARIAALQKRQDVLQQAYANEIEAETEYRILKAQLETYEEDIKNIIRSHPDYKNATDYEVDALIYDELASQKGREWFYNQFGSYAKKYGTTDFKDQLILAQYPSVKSADGEEKKLEFFDTLEQFSEAQSEYANAQRETALAIEEYEKADNALREYGIEIENATAATGAATQAQNDYNTALENEVKAFETVEKAWTAVKEHRDETYNQMRESLKNGTNDLWGVVADLSEIDINKSMKTAQDTMSENIDFYTQYAANLRAAERIGVDKGLLAELATNQTAENYALLEYMYNRSDQNEIKALNDSWRNLQAAKDTLADTMTDASLAVDEGYASMVETAQKAVDELNQYETARKNAYDTGAGVVDGISAKIPEIEEKMNQINEIMQSVGATPISIDFDLGGNAGAANNLETAIANGAERGTRSAIAAQKLSVDAAMLARALLPTINAAMNVKVIEGRYG